MDLCDLVDVRGNRYGWLVVVVQHTDYPVIAPCSLRQKGRVEQSSRKWRVSAFSYQLFTRRVKE